ncbi:MAG: hypothetical protein RDU30_09755 [Desulfovibrionaceae bacterium]|nr:hypothetical protein [Desulfovibrionaceae bacterium]
MDDFCDYAAKVLGEQQSDVLRRFMRALVDGEKPPVGLVFAGHFGKTTVARELVAFAGRKGSDVFWVCDMGDEDEAVRDLAVTVILSRRCRVGVVTEFCASPEWVKEVFPERPEYVVIKFETVEKFHRRLDFDPESVERFWMDQPGLGAARLS